MKKRKVVVLIGGESNEHDVSIISGFNIYKEIPEDIYEKKMIYLDKNNVAYFIDESEFSKKISIKYIPENISLIDNFEKALKEFDIVFPVIHGKIGEDGVIQGICIKNKIKCVGCKLLSSAICMDKAYQKLLLEKRGVPLPKYIYIKENYGKFNVFIDDDFKILSIEEIKEEVKNKLKFPVFVKPSNSGSSVGVTKVNDINELEKAIFIALKEDKKILIEEGIIGEELECAVFEKNGEIKAVKVGRITPAEDFYTFDAKYINQKEQTEILDLEKEEEKKIFDFAERVFKLLDCEGLARLDMFRTKEGKLYLLEVNTMPGFTENSLYPKLLNSVNIPTSEALTALIEDEFNR